MYTAAMLEHHMGTMWGSVEVLLCVACYASRYCCDCYAVALQHSMVGTPCHSLRFSTNKTVRKTKTRL